VDLRHVTKAELADENAELRDWHESIRLLNKELESELTRVKKKSEIIQSDLEGMLDAGKLAKDLIKARLVVSCQNSLQPQIDEKGQEVPCEEEVRWLRYLYDTIDGYPPF